MGAVGLYRIKPIRQPKQNAPIWSGSMTEIVGDILQVTAFHGHSEGIINGGRQALPRSSSGLFQDKLTYLAIG
jgi:hypothetical protein